MLHESFDKAHDFQISGEMTVFNETTLKLFSGEIFWELCHQNGTVETGHVKNIVTLDAGILLARLMKSPAIANVSEPAFGIFALAVGTGDVGWDPLNPPPATITQRSLYNELARKQIASSNFITAGGTISGVPTNKVDFTTIFSEAEAVGALTEMGLVGGDINTNMAIRNPVLPPNGTYDATVDLVGKDTLVNYVTFPVINKPPTSTLRLTWRITT